jgi:hypothetical protein
MAYKDYLTEQAKLKKDGFEVPEAPSTEGVKLGTGVNAQKDISSPTTPTAPEYTFEQYLTDERARYDQLYKDTLAQIAASREKTIVDAGAARAKQVGTYGANAERLASMGLTGSGYSDYLTAQAHSAYRGDVQAANALAAQQELTAKQGYEETMAGLRKMEYENYVTQQQKSANLTQSEADFQQNIEANVFGSLGTLRKQMESKGHSEEAIARQLANLEKKFAPSDESLVYIKSVDNEDGTTTDTLTAVTDEEIDALVKADQITETTAAALKQKRNEKLIDAIRKAAEDTADIGNFQSYLLNYKDILGDEAVRDLNYEYNAKIALKDLTSATLKGEIEGVFDEAEKGYLSEQDAVSLGAYKIAAVAKGVYVPSGDVEVKTSIGGTIEGTIVSGSGFELAGYNRTKVSDEMGKALSEYAGNLPGTVVMLTEGGAFFNTGNGWIRAVRHDGITSNDMTPKSYDLPKKDNGYSDYLTTK